MFMQEVMARNEQLLLQKSQKMPGFIGLMVTQEPPHAVKEVHDLVDMAGIVQGAPGYSNERVDVGDLITAINGQDVRQLSLEALHALLRGEQHTSVEITLQRKQTMAAYGVKVLRHRPHEYPERETEREREPDSAPTAPGRQDEPSLQELLKKLQAHKALAPQLSDAAIARQQQEILQVRL